MNGFFDFDRFVQVVDRILSGDSRLNIGGRQRIINVVVGRRRQLGWPIPGPRGCWRPWLVHPGSALGQRPGLRWL